MIIPNIWKNNPVMFFKPPTRQGNIHQFSWLQILITQLFGTQIFTQLFLLHPPEGSWEFRQWFFAMWWKACSLSNNSPKMDGMMDAMIIRIFDE